MNDASSDARNSAACATSSTVPRRPSGCIASICERQTGSSVSVRVNGLYTNAGHSAFTRTPRAPKLFAMSLVRPMTPCLPGGYGSSPVPKNIGRPTSP